MLMHEKTCVIPIFSIRVENSVDHLILIRCPCQNPADLDLQCFQKSINQGSTGQGFILTTLDLDISCLETVQNQIS